MPRFRIQMPEVPQGTGRIRSEMARRLHRFGSSGTPSPPPPPPNWNYYISWVLYAILGKLREADGMMKRFQSQIYSVAHYLQRLMLPPSNMLYRGVLLEPKEIHEGFLDPDLNYKSVSFTEDKQVACWFADPKSSMSSYVLQIRPGVKGYVVEYHPDLREILFHHSWHTLPLPIGEKSLSELAHLHPDIEPQAFQLDWALRTQKEVIVKPVKTKVAVTLIGEAGCHDTAELEGAYGPTWDWTAS